MNTVSLRALADLLSAHNLLVQAALDQDVAIWGASCDSRTVEPNNLFICKGAAFKPRFLEMALERGAAAYVAPVELAAELAQAAPDTPHLIVSDIRAAMAYVSAAAWGRPDRALKIVGITGTKGKSTTMHLVRQLLEQLTQEPIAYMGTHQNFDGSDFQESQNTTPEPPDLWRHLAMAKANGVHYVVMEVSSQALKYDRTLGVPFAAGCFLNIGNDHISPVEHPTFEDYFASKLRLFGQSGTAIINLETDHAAAVLEAARAQGVPVVTYALHDAEATVFADNIKPAGNTMHFVADVAGEKFPLELALAGEYNVSNALAALGIAYALGFDSTAIERAAAAAFAAAKAPGRMEINPTADGRVIGVVDYAHNDTSYDRFFEAIHQLYPEAYVISAFGVCGGKALNRYEELPRIGSTNSDCVILTSDEPGPVDADELLDIIEVNVVSGTPYEKISDREAALERGFELACETAEHTGKTVVFCALGKGDEKTITYGREIRSIESDSDHMRRLVAAYDATHAAE